MKKRWNYLSLIVFLIIIFSLLDTNALENTDGNFYVGYAIRDIAPSINNYNEIEKKNKNMPKVGDCDEYNNSKSKAVNPIPLAGFGNETLRATETQCNDKDNHIKTTVVAIKDNNGNYIVFVSADLVSFLTDSVNNGSGFVVNTIRNEIASYIKDKLNGLKIDVNNIMLSASHNHSGPYYAYNGTNDMKKSVVVYNNFMKRQIKEAVVEAIKDMKKASISYDTLEMFLDKNGAVTNKNYNGEKKYLNFVRHYTTDNYFYENGSKIVRGVSRGLYGIHCSSSTYNLANCDREYTNTKPNGHTRNTDHKMQIIKIDFDNAKPILMINWQAHPTLEVGSPKTVINADYIGYLRNYLGKNGYRVSFFQGGAGDINATTYMKSEALYSTIKNEKKSITYDYDINSLYDGKIAASFTGNKLGEIIINRIKSGFKNKINYKNGIDFYKENNKNIYDSNLVNGKRKSWNDKDSKGNYIYNINTYTNAYFINSFYNAAVDFEKNKSDTLKKMINGDYYTTEWDNDWNYVDHSGKEISFRFPKYFMNNNNNNNNKTLRKDVSEKLISFLRKYNESIFSNMFDIQKNSDGDYKLVGYKNFNLSRINNVTILLGTMFDDLDTIEVDERIISHTHASSILSLYKNTAHKNVGSYKMALYAFSIGDIAFATAPYEMFSSSAKYIKDNSPYAMTFVLAYTNGKYGYVPDFETFKYKSYETDITYFVQGTAESNAKNLVTKLKSIHNNSSSVKKDTIKSLDTNTKIKNNYVIINIPREHQFTFSELKEKINITSIGATVKKSNGVTVKNNDSLGTGSIIIFGDKEYKIIITGDVNKDGKLSALDYIKIKKHVMKTSIINKTDDAYNAADMNEDGTISVSDYISLRKKFLGG